MGPRMFIRGNNDRRKGTLNSGSGFNGAADVHPRKRPGRDDPGVGRAASMGPRMFIRGNLTPRQQADAPPDRFNGAADVHPRKLAKWRERERRLCASMGPRMFIRGNALEAIASKNHDVLQWGRGCSSAETPEASHITSLFASLQWGRGCSSAETPVMNEAFDLLA